MRYRSIVHPEIFVRIRAGIENRANIKQLLANTVTECAVYVHAEVSRQQQLLLPDDGQDEKDACGMVI